MSTLSVQPDLQKFTLCQKLYFQNGLVRGFSTKSYNSLLPKYYNK